MSWFRRIHFAIANFLYSDKFIFPPKSLEKTIATSGIYNTRIGLDFSSIQRDWDEARELWRIGEIHLSKSKKEAILMKVYSHHGLLQEEYSPPYMSCGWAGAIGHLGVLSGYLLAQELKLIPNSVKTLPVDLNGPMLENSKLLFSNKLQIVTFSEGMAFGEHPNMWPFSERMEMVKGYGEFIGINKMTDDAYKGRVIDSSNAVVKLSSTYIEEGWATLRRLGMPNNAWFVALHIRNKTNVNDVRMVQDRSSFNKAIKEIIRQGGWVINFGVEYSDTFADFPNFIDLTSNRKIVYRGLDLFLLSACRFLLITLSGPIDIAHALGTPVLHTNSISIGYNIHAATRNSIYLPKKIISQIDGPLSYERLVSSPLGYSGENLEELAARGIRLECNSEQEIYLATLEILESTRGESKVYNSDLELKIQRIRKNYNVIGNGKIADSYLVENAEWFLN
jgi:putative glycosyltransferase (TIGR04372 family)